MLERHLATMRAGTHTHSNYSGYLRNHITPLIGHLRVNAVTPETLDGFYAELARCRDHCGTPAHRPITNRPTTTRAEPQDKSPRHACRPLSDTTIRKIHFLISAAYTRARRWGWIHTSPTPLASPPPVPSPNPQPPTPDEVTRILTHAWPNPDLGVLIWIAIITGARRGELCALRWTDFHPDRPVLYIVRNIAQHNRHTVEKDTKNHQHRHIALDPDTTALLLAYRRYRELHADRHGDTLRSDAFIFSPAPDGTRRLKPSTFSQRYRRLVVRLGIHTTLHKLRHFSATELILARVDLRTVASRLGHTNASLTLNTYTAWISEADQHATTTLTQRIPVRLTPPPRHQPIPQPSGLYQPIAADLRNAITNGTYPVGSPLPTNNELATHYHVSRGTIHRAITQLAEQKLITVSRGRRAIVLAAAPTSLRTPTPTPPPNKIPFPVPTPQPQPRPRAAHRHRTARQISHRHVAGIRNSQANQRNISTSPKHDTLPNNQHIKLVDNQALRTTNDATPSGANSVQIAITSAQPFTIVLTSTPQ
ncbi:tyrosine-type recombinase/integrase [Kibdelosporangium phytohabitans]|nr:tyrosine-type recombinase/integrase [Kibdelosporangium phytohabitans]